jgi:hypothetical protein
MSTQEAQHIWLEESVRTVRSLPLPRALGFLRGMISSCLDTAMADELRKVYTSLAASDRQLQLIEEGQLRLNFVERRAA